MSQNIPLIITAQRPRLQVLLWFIGRRSAARLVAGHDDVRLYDRRDHLLCTIPYAHITAVHRRPWQGGAYARIDYEDPDQPLPAGVIDNERSWSIIIPPRLYWRKCSFTLADLDQLIAWLRPRTTAEFFIDPGI